MICGRYSPDYRECSEKVEEFSILPLRYYCVNSKIKTRLWGLAITFGESSIDKFEVIALFQIMEDDISYLGNLGRKLEPVAKHFDLPAVEDRKVVRLV
jgi:hypothetical protein